MSAPAATIAPRATATRSAPAPDSRAAAIQRDLDQARAKGPLQQIVVPPCPSLLVQLREAMSQPEPDLVRVARIATSDVAMSAALIRQANAPIHAVGGPVRTVGAAMDRLGLDHTAMGMTRFLAQHALPVDSRHLARYWEQSSVRATAMAVIAQQLPGVSHDLAYTCGLFLHVGQPVMLQSVRGYASTLIEAPARRDRSFTATENANHRTDHAVVGALVARVWQLEPAVMAAIRLHHDLDVLRDERTEPEVRTLVAALLVAEQMMRRHEAMPADADWTAHGASALGWLHVAASDLDDWQDALAQHLAGA